jgi:hypothetical protein
VQIREFVRTHSRYEFGLVSQALSSAIRQLLREFDVLVAQLEHLLNGNRLSLQKMVYLLQPSKNTLRMLEKVSDVYMIAPHCTSNVTLNELTHLIIICSLHVRLFDDSVTVLAAVCWMVSTPAF